MSKEKLGKYTLIRQIAEGGMAQIWLAEQRGPGGFNKELVIKRILPHLAEEGDMTKMFFDEARIVAHLTHPNIGQVFELGEQDGDYFIAMEFIDGLDLVELRETIDERDMTLPVSYAARIVCDVLQALDYAHNYVDRDGNHVGLIHRDISPHNVLISNDGVVKLVDFGVAKAAINTHKTKTGAVKGKFAYMAPEQIENNDLDHRVDIFAVGVVFFELLTSQKPFGNDLQAVSKIIAEDRPDPRELRSDIPDAVCEIIARALACDRDDRYSTAAEMERDLESYLHDVEGMVGNRQLSVMVHQLRGLEVKKPTEQMYGFQKHGVDREKPRVTKRDADTGAIDRVTQDTSLADSDTSASESQQGAGDTAVQYVGAESSSQASSQGPDAEAADASTPLKVTARKSRSEQATEVGADTSSAGSYQAVASANEPPPPRGVTVLSGLGFMVAMTALLAAFIIGGLVVLGSAETAEIEAQEPTVSEWKHSEDALVVFIDADEPAALYREGQEVGSTPFHTYLRPGDYRLELRGQAGEQTEVEISVKEGQPIQRYRFEL